MRRDWRTPHVRVQLVTAYLMYHRISADGELLQSEEITVGGPTMMQLHRHTKPLNLP